MARYEHLPIYIYKAAMDIAISLDALVAQFSRYHKYTTGQDLRNLDIEILNRVLARGRKTFMFDEGSLTGGVRQRYAREIMWSDMQRKTGAQV